MPAFIKTEKDEKIWLHMKKQVAEQTGKAEKNFTDIEWRRVNFLFQKAKKKYKSRCLPKKYQTSASFKDLVKDTYVLVEALKPIEHFNNSVQPFWSIQTERTHGDKGVVKVSKSQLEDPFMGFKTRDDYFRMAGAEDIFQGSKDDLLSYLNTRFRNFKTIEFKGE